MALLPLLAFCIDHSAAKPQKNTGTSGAEPRKRRKKRNITKETIRHEPLFGGQYVFFRRLRGLQIVNPASHGGGARAYGTSLAPACVPPPLARLDARAMRRRREIQQGNHQSLRQAALLHAAAMNPDGHESHTWVDFALERGVRHILEDFRADGSLKENAPSYHAFETWHVRDIIGLASRLDRKVSAEVMERVRRVGNAQGDTIAASETSNRSEWQGVRWTRRLECPDYLLAIKDSIKADMEHEYTLNFVLAPNVAVQLLSSHELLLLAGNAQLRMAFRNDSAITLESSVVNHQSDPSSEVMRISVKLPKADNAESLTVIECLPS
ncbi:MAG: heparinase II/III family protein [Victivallales bacterium]|nr:heparinase II/III family protein [Victivallales bacterium]